MHALVADDDAELLRELTGSGKDGWSVREMACEGSMCTDEGAKWWCTKGGGRLVCASQGGGGDEELTEVVVQMRLVAVDWKADGYTGAVACCSRGRWYLRGARATQLGLRRWGVTVQVDGAMGGEVLVSGTRRGMCGMSRDEGTKGALPITGHIDSHVYSY